MSVSRERHPRTGPDRSTRHLLHERNESRPRVMLHTRDISRWTEILFDSPSLRRHDLRRFTRTYRRERRSARGGSMAARSWKRVWSAAARSLPAIPARSRLVRLLGRVTQRREFSVAARARPTAWNKTPRQPAGPVMSGSMSHGVRYERGELCEPVVCWLPCLS